MQETQVRSLGWEPPWREEGMETHSSMLAWEIPWAEEPGYSPQGCSGSDTTEQEHILLLLVIYYLSALCS